MNESVKLYEAAEMGNEKLKKVIQTKDSKLQQAEMELLKLRKVSCVQSITSSTAYANNLYFVYNMDIQQIKKNKYININLTLGFLIIFA